VERWLHDLHHPPVIFREYGWILGCSGRVMVRLRVFTRASVCTIEEFLYWGGFGEPQMLGKRKNGVSWSLRRSSRLRAHPITITSSVFCQDDVIAIVTQYFPRQCLQHGRQERFFANFDGKRRCVRFYSCWRSCCLHCYTERYLVDVRKLKHWKCWITDSL